MTCLRTRLAGVVAGLAAAVLLAGCGGGGGGVPPAADPPAGDPCSLAAQRTSLRDYMELQYYFTPAAGDAQAATIDGYFQSLLSRPQDRYSYSEPTGSTVLAVAGRRLGWGYTVAWADAAQTVMKVRNVEPGSPVALAGMRRGDTVLAIGGRSPAQIAAGELAPAAAAGELRDFQTVNAAGLTRSFTVTSDFFALSMVPATGTYTVQRQGSPVRVGYVALQQFATYGYLDLGNAFKALAAQGVQELIVDLRYNGGGSVALSRDLASMVAAARGDAQTYARLRYSARSQTGETTIPFLTQAATLPAPPLQGLSRVVVVVSGATASASEAFINGLKPLMPVVLIGETTFGKPYGFIAREACGTTFNAVNFELTNGQGAGGYTAGFVPDCAVADDLGRELGDPQEARLRAALYYVANGRCEAAAPQSAAAEGAGRDAAFGELPRAGMTLH